MDPCIGVKDWGSWLQNSGVQLCSFYLIISKTFARLSVSAIGADCRSGKIMQESRWELNIVIWPDMKIFF
jgi:hypothetical protein